MSEQAVVKFFVGYLFNGEIKLLLNQSKTWKETALFQNQLLKIVNFESKEYVGLYCDSPLQYNQIKQVEEDIKSHLYSCCPKLTIIKNKLYVFPELFLS